MKETFGQLIKRKRIEKGLSRAEVSERIGRYSSNQKRISPVSLQWIEEDGKIMPPIAITALANLLELNKNDLFEMIKNEEINKLKIELDKRYSQFMN